MKLTGTDELASAFVDKWLDLFEKFSEWASPRPSSPFTLVPLSRVGRMWHLRACALAHGVRPMFVRRGEKTFSCGITVKR